MGNQITNTRYGMMLYPQQDEVIGKNLFLYGEWYQSEMECMKPYIPLGGVCIDVGANIGCHTLFFARRVGREGAVVAFEPQHVLFQILAANVALNDFRNVITFSSAVGQKSDKLFFPPCDYDQPGNFGMIGRSREGVLVEQTCLDNFHFSKVDLIKIDVEGMEPEVLLGAKQTIEKHRPAIYLEYHPEAHSCDLKKILHELGYEVHEHLAPGYNPQNLKNEIKNIHGDFLERNLLCLPRA